MRALLVASGLVAWAIGLALLLAAGPFLAGMGLSLDEGTATLGQAQGALLIGLGLVNWLSRSASREAAGPVLAGNLAVQVLSIGVNLRAVLLGLVAPRAWGAVAMHLVLGALFAWFLLRPALRRPAGA